MKKTKLFAMVLCLGIACGSVQAYSGYYGTVYKYSDFESSTSYKANSSTLATNYVVELPSGNFCSWVEAASTFTNVIGINITEGTNVTDKAYFSGISVNYMSYTNNYANIFYERSGPARLNISTTLTNFTSGTVRGYWSPDFCSF